MAWLSQFKLGRPGAMSLFEINPAKIDPTRGRLADQDRAIDGSLLSVTFSKDRPMIRIHGNYITVSQVNQFSSLANISDTPLTFQAVDLSGGQLWETWTDYVIPSTTTSIVLPDNSFLKGSALQVAAGGATGITFLGLWDAPGTTGGASGTGTERMVGPGYTYNEPTRTITLTVPLADTNPRYLSYRVSVMACEIFEVPTTHEGGWSDFHQYDLLIVGA